MNTEEIINILICNWVSITGMLIVNIGLIISISGAVKIYRTDIPRNDWILETANKLANIPSYATIAPNDYSPQAEKAENFSKAQLLKEEMDAYNKNNQSGMKLISYGFVIQFIGNMIWGMLYLFTQ